MSQNPGARQPAPGFYPDPSGVVRWWDGTSWTDRVQTGPPHPVPAPNKSHTVRNILLAILAMVVLVIGGCVAFLGFAANEVNEAIETAEAEDAAPGGSDNPLTIVEGQGFDVSGFRYASGWQVSQDSFGDVRIEGLKVTNNRTERDGALVEVKFMRGNEVVALVDCSTEQIPVGQTTTLNCISADNFPTAYDRITINDTF
ncbi:DUF2510 domain-containing protein [Rhodococcus zopfii]|uniref:DUF2510 domain-containing protein n=1 Tax=Rhodococcus zopfii TaxID=43772 RepID=UPI0009FA63B2|nr:DUF2510 domain-containing protein [Rhodococcus zopfii]